MVMLQNIEKCKSLHFTLWFILALYIPNPFETMFCFVCRIKSYPLSEVVRRWEGNSDLPGDLLIHLHVWIVPQSGILML